MNFIAITGSNFSKRSNFAKAFSAMTGIDMIASVPYLSIASKYKLDTEISKCEWPDSYAYCLGAFTQRIIVEQKYEESYISDGSVFNELCWLKCRYPHMDLIYERSMIRCLENVIVDYALNEYDFIFHITSNDPSDLVDQCLRQLYLHRNIKHHVIDATNGEEALNQMLDHLQIKPLLSAKYSLLKFTKDFLLNNETHENSN